MDKPVAPIVSGTVKPACLPEGRPVILVNNFENFHAAPNIFPTVTCFYNKPGSISRKWILPEGAVPQRRSLCAYRATTHH